jgi:hypothetical protein
MPRYLPVCRPFGVRGRKMGCSFCVGYAAYERCRFTARDNARAVVRVTLPPLVRDFRIRGGLLIASPASLVDRRRCDCTDDDSGRPASHLRDAHRSH